MNIDVEKRKRINEYFDKKPKIPVVDYMSRISDVGLLYKTLYKTYQEVGKPVLELKMSSGLQELVEEFIVDDLDERNLFVDEFLNETKKKLDKFEQKICNQGLVAICTIFDAYLSEIVDNIVKVTPGILYGSSVSNNLTLSKVVESESIEKLLDNLREKEVTNFSHMNINNKIGYLKKRGIKTGKLFDGSFEKTPKNTEMDLCKLGDLLGLYDKRNQVVHYDSIEITTLDELIDVQEFFLRISLILSVVVCDKFKTLINELSLPTIKHEFYNSDVKLDLR